MKCPSVCVEKTWSPCLGKTGTTRKRHAPNRSSYPGITLGWALYLTALYNLATSNGHHGDVRKQFTDRLHLDGRACGLQNPPTLDKSRGINHTTKGRFANPSPPALILHYPLHPNSIFSQPSRLPHDTKQTPIGYVRHESNLSRGGAGWGTSRALCLETREGGSNSIAYSEKRVWTYSHYPNRLGRVRESSMEKAGQRSLAEES